MSSTEQRPATYPVTYAFNRAVNRHRIASVFHDRRRRRIGLLGGSFNPAHDGHGHIADLALRHLNLDEIWWLVTPQNPLKSASGMACFDDRFASAVTIASRSRFSNAMKVSALEHQLGSRHTAISLKTIRQRAPRASFFWIMGADNLAGFHHWHQPRTIARTMPIIVVNRPGKTNALGSIGAHIAGQRYQPRRLAARPSKNSKITRCWCFIHGPLNPLSATAIRAQINSS